MKYGGMGCYITLFSPSDVTAFHIIYLGLMLRAHTRKGELFDKLSYLVISIAYDRVLRIAAELVNGVCQRFRAEREVCPTKLCGIVSTISAVDNIDHNPSPTTGLLPRN